MSSRTLLARCLRPRLRLCPAQPFSLSTRIRLLSTLPNTPIFRALQDHGRDSLAIVHSASSRSFTYGNLVADVLLAKEDLERKAVGAGTKLAGERIAFLAENSYDYVGLCFLYQADLSAMLIVGASDSPGHLCQRCYRAAFVGLFPGR